MANKELQIIYEEFESAKDFSPEEQKLIENTKEILENSYSPYSHFKVGAAVLLDNGKIVRGSNQENAAYPSGLCAERVALFHANSEFPASKVLTIAVAAANTAGLLASPVPPCGSCRQVMLETEIRFQSPIKVILIGAEKFLVFHSSADLLPIQFNHNFLKH